LVHGYWSQFSYKKPYFAVSRYGSTSAFTSEDIYSCNDEDDCILSVSVADEDDIAGDVDWHTNVPIKMQPLAALTVSEQIAVAKLEQVARSSFAIDYDSLGCCNISKNLINKFTNT
jgi:hypothetical protein